MLVLFTDFGIQSPYVGLLKRALWTYAPATIPVIDLCHDAAAFDVQAAAYLLASYAIEFPAESIFIGVVDPGVGSNRKGLILQADERIYVGPDNGLFDRIAARAERTRAWHIIWRTAEVSATFHGRDIFAPVAAMLAAQTASPDDLGEEFDFIPRSWPDDLARIVYIDHYGNTITGIRAASMGMASLSVNKQALPRMRTFSDVAPGESFWYANSSGLAEITVNQGSAAAYYGLSTGDAIEVSGQTLTEIRVR